MKLFQWLMLPCLLQIAAHGQDLHDWQSGSQLQTGDPVRVSLKTGPVNGVFENWTLQDIKIGTVTAKREDVLSIERFRRNSSRGKHVLLGALIGFGGGFGIGAGVTGRSGVGIGVWVARPEGGAVVGGAGAIVGAIVGALLPAHPKELIYSSK